MRAFLYLFNTAYFGWLPLSQHTIKNETHLIVNLILHIISYIRYNSNAFHSLPFGTGATIVISSFDTG